MVAVVADTEVAPRAGRARPVLPVAQAAVAPETVERLRRAPDLDGLAVRWQRTFVAADRALGAARGSLPPDEVGRRRQGLARERRETAVLLERVARTSGVEPLPWLSPVPVVPQMLGLPAGTTGCLFDLEGVLTDGAGLHAWAWTILFDELLERLSVRVGWRLAPFGAADYRAYLEGRPRLEGIHAFLASRGLNLPEGDPRDPSDADTAHALARRKGELLSARLHPRGVTALAGAHRYLQAAGQAGLGRAVISASSSTLPMLDLAGLTALIDERVDAEVMSAEHLRARPAPDLLVTACRRLGLAPEHAVTLTHTPAGVAAGRAAGLAVLGIADGADARRLVEAGADSVVPSVGALLDARLVPAADA